MYILFAQVDYSRMRRLYSTFQTQKSQHASRTLVNHFCREFIFSWYIFLSFFFWFLFVLFFSFVVLNNIIQSSHLCETSYQAFGFIFKFYQPIGTTTTTGVWLMIILMLKRHIITTIMTGRAEGEKKKRRERKEIILLCSPAVHIIHETSSRSSFSIPYLSLSSSPTRPPISRTRRTHQFAHRLTCIDTCNTKTIRLEIN